MRFFALHNLHICGLLSLGVMDIFGFVLFFPSAINGSSILYIAAFCPCCWIHASQVSFARRGAAMPMSSSLRKLFRIDEICSRGRMRAMIPKS